MIDTVTQRPRARLDLLEQFVYFGEQAGAEVAERYFAAVEETCSARHTPSEQIALRLRDSEAGWVAARPGEGIRRVLHAARDIQKILGTEEN